MSDDIIMDILSSFSNEVKQEISELSFPAKGDSVFSHQRDLEGKFGGGEIIEANRIDDEYTVGWWNPADGGIHLDCTVFEKMDFICFKDGRSGRLWYSS